MAAAATQRFQASVILAQSYLENNLSTTASNSTTVDETQLNSLDSDGDTLTDYEETKYYGTDPFNQDTDGDGLGDGNEIKGWVWEIEESRSRQELYDCVESMCNSQDRSY